LVLRVFVWVEASELAAFPQAVSCFQVQVKERTGVLLRGRMVVGVQKRRFGKSCQHRQRQKDEQRRPYRVCAYITNGVRASRICQASGLSLASSGKVRGRAARSDNRLRDATGYSLGVSGHCGAAKRGLSRVEV
jgi:hypothetical protein